MRSILCMLIMIGYSVILSAQERITLYPIIISMQRMLLIDIWLFYLLTTCSS